MGKQTPLYHSHLSANAKMVDFAGWDMPLHYGSQLQEHKVVRESAGIFDVSHMTIVDIEGKDTKNFLRYLLANNIDRLQPGKALYTCMLNEAGGVIDDLIVYQIEEHSFRLVVNSGTHDKDLAWITKQAQRFQVTITEKTDLAMLAIQGPKAFEKMRALFSEEDIQKISALKSFHFIFLKDFFIARTGYTGEEGVEIILPAKVAETFWQKVLAAGISPCGLGARDTLRLEAGLNLYGADMDESVSPLQSNLAWTVAFDPIDRDFIGRAALQKEREEGVKQKLVGLVLETPGVLRNHQKVFVGENGEGEITSGSFSPTLGKGIALARVPAHIGETCLVDVRGKKVSVKVIKPPFVKKTILVNGVIS